VEIHCTAGQATDDKTIWRMRIECWITKSINTHSEYVILIDSPLQQWLQESASISPYTTLPLLFRNEKRIKKTSRALFGPFKSTISDSNLLLPLQSHYIHHTKFFTSLYFVHYSSHANVFNKVYISL